jgi:hypothetical protein
MKGWPAHWSSRRKFLFMLLIPLALGMDIALVSLIFRIARIYW